MTKHYVRDVEHPGYTWIVNGYGKSRVKKSIWRLRAEDAISNIIAWTVALVVVLLIIVAYTGIHQWLADAGAYQSEVKVQMTKKDQFMQECLKTEKYTEDVCAILAGGVK